MPGNPSWKEPQGLISLRVVPKPRENALRKGRLPLHPPILGIPGAWTRILEGSSTSSRAFGAFIPGEAQGREAKAESGIWEHGNAAVGWGSPSPG